jgi:putative oxidoreductase
MFPLYIIYDTWAVLFLRVVLGAVFIAHGWPKLRDLKQNAKNFDAMGFKPGKLFGTLAGLLEFFGGIAFILGILVTPIATLFMLEFVVIIVWKWLKRIAFTGAGGWELDLIILAGVFVLFTLGAGAFAL